jgi:hypothetical protein
MRLKDENEMVFFFEAFFFLVDEKKEGFFSFGEIERWMTVNSIVCMKQ